MGVRRSDLDNRACERKSASKGAQVAIPRFICSLHCLGIAPCQIGAFSNQIYSYLVWVAAWTWPHIIIDISKINRNPVTNTLSFHQNVELSVLGALDHNGQRFLHKARDILEEYVLKYFKLTASFP